MSAPPSPTLTVVIPAFRESLRIGDTVSRVLAFFGAAGVSCEVIVVDDGSGDGTPAVVNTAAGAGLNVSLIELPLHRGKGAAVHAGLAASRGSLVLICDADLAIPLDEYPVLAAAVDAGADVAIASKEMGRRRGLVAQPLLRTVMGRIFNAVVRLLVLPDFLDTQAGFKLLRGGAARALAAELTVDGFACDVEILSLALARGYNVIELPVRCRLTGRTSVRVFSDSLRMLKDLLAVRRRTGRQRRKADRDAQTR